MNFEKPVIIVRNAQVWPPAKPFFSTTRQTLPVLTYGGLGATPSQWESIGEAMPSRTQLIISGYAGQHRSIDDLVDLRTRELVALDRRVILMPHSMGALIAAKVAERVPRQVAGIIALAPVAPREVWLPVSSLKRTVRLEYLKAMITKSAVRVQEDDVAFLQDGSSAFIDRTVAGRTLWELGWLGYSAPRFSSLECRKQTKIIFAKDDKIVPEGTATKIAAHHGVKPIVLDSGGHYFFNRSNDASFGRLNAAIQMAVQEWS